MDKIRQHLINHDNITKEIIKWQQSISETFSQQLKLVSGTDLLEEIADRVNNLNPLYQLKYFGGGTLLIIVILIIL
jgi:hypothetical protein